jgi:hypothetical protein
MKKERRIALRPGPPGFQGGTAMTGAIHADLIDVKAQVRLLPKITTTHNS